MWQDYVIGITQWIFLIALIPSILHPTNKPPFSTSTLTGTLLLILALTYGSLGLMTALISSGALGLGWLYLGFQRAHLNRKAGVPIIEWPSFIKRKNGSIN